MPWPARRDVFAASSGMPASARRSATFKASGIAFSFALRTASKRLLGQQGLGLLGVLHGAPHPVEELVELLLLLLEALPGLLALSGIAEGTLGVAVPGVEPVGELALLLVEAAGLVAHLGHLLGEPIRGVLAEILADVVELPAGAGAFGEGLREPAFLERLGGLADVLAALLDLLAGVGHAVAVLLALHPLAELVGVADGSAAAGRGAS